jgi:hypothetical protein
MTGDALNRRFSVRRTILSGILVVLVAVVLIGQQSGVTGTQQDDFRRERGSEGVSPKDALEGKAPPVLQVSGWMNTGGKALKLEDLKGKVVILDFWGTW